MLMALSNQCARRLTFLNIFKSFDGTAKGMGFLGPLVYLPVGFPRLSTTGILWYRTS